MTGTLRTTSTPGASSGTRIMLWRRCGSASGSVTPITIEIRQCGCAAPEMNHLRPLTTYSSPSRRIAVWMLVASDDATSGSVIAKHERIVPSSSGTSHCSRCAGVANRCRISMLPVSGALQLKTSEAHITRPMISASGAYSRLVRRVPGSSSRSAGRNRFQSPSERASALRSSMHGGCGLPAATSRRHCGTTGSTRSSMNSRTRCRSCSTRGEYSKSMAVSSFGHSWRRAPACLMKL